MHDLETTFAQLKFIRRIIERRPGLELLVYLVSMAIQEAEDQLRKLTRESR